MPLMGVSIPLDLAIVASPWIVMGVLWLMSE